MRARLATGIDAQDIDVLIVGPVTRAGMETAGTIQEVRDFLRLVDSTRPLCERPLTTLLVHQGDMPVGLRCLVVGGVTFLAMTAVTAAYGEPEPLLRGAIWGCTAGLISFPIRRFAGWSTPTYRRDATRREIQLVVGVGAIVVVVVLTEIVVRYVL